MEPTSPIFYIIGMVVGTLALAFIGLTGRMFMAGVRDQIIKQLVDSTLKTVLGDIQTGIKELKADMSLVKTAQQITAGSDLLKAQEIAALRKRVEEHLVSDESWQDLERVHRIKVDTFMDWASNFLKTHMHVGATAEEPPKPI